MRPMKPKPPTRSKLTAEVRRIVRANTRLKSGPPRARRPIATAVLRPADGDPIGG